MEKAYIVSAARTAIGAFEGSLSGFPATELGGIAIREAVKRANVDPSLVQESIMGCVIQAGLGQNPARQAALKAGLPNSVESLTINKVCGSGLKAVMLAAQAIQSNDADIIVAGGMENMTKAPYVMPSLRSGARMNNTKMFDAMILDGLWEAYYNMHMGETADKVSEKYSISREEQDVYAAESYAKSKESIEKGYFRDEIVEVLVPQKKGEPKPFVIDEIYRDTPYDTLQSLKPAFTKNGTVTAGNASKISDGASALVVMSERKMKELGLKPMARIVAQCAAAWDPMWVLVTPILSIPKCLNKAGLKESDIAFHEINDAFAASSLAVVKELGIDRKKVNVRGSAISLGHPIGASGARLLTTLLYTMRDCGGKYGMVSLCLGGGEAVSMIVENMM
ncbi:MAG: acetyl-CoA C-acetyltransferase [bacterium]